MLLLALLVCAAPLGYASASAPVLRVEGNLIRDLETGKEFVPHGVNWPSFEYACQQGWGYSGPGATLATAEAMLDWRINTVRIPLNQDCWLGEDGLPATRGGGPVLTAEGYRDAVESFVNLLTDNGIVAIPVLHWSAPPGFEADGLRPMPDSRSDDFWLSVASRLKYNRAVIFDLFNEPHSRWDPELHKSPPGSGIGAWDFRLTWESWRNGGSFATNHADTDYPFWRPKYETTGMAALVSAVRATGATQPIVLSGLDYANDLSGWKASAPGDNQLIAGFHNYPGQRCSNVECWNHEIAGLALDVPVITAEFGQKDCRSDFIKSYMNWADGFHIGYLAWAWWDLDLLPGGAPACTNYGLLEDLDGSPTQPYGTTFRDHLLALPETLPQVKPFPRDDPGLTIAGSWTGRRALQVKVRLDPEASGPVGVEIRLFRPGTGRTLKRSFKARVTPIEGLGELRRSIPRNWKPANLAATYPGDQKFLPDVANDRMKVRP